MSDQIAVHTMVVRQNVPDGGMLLECPICGEQIILDPWNSEGNTRIPIKAGDYDPMKTRHVCGTSGITLDFSDSTDSNMETK